MSKKKLRVLMVSDDVDTILSYGLLGKMLIDRLYKDIDIHYLSLQRNSGRPINREGKYIKYASHLISERNPANLPNIISRVNPDIIWTNFDVQVYHTFVNNHYIPKNITWCGWLPWDNHDAGQIPRAQVAFKDVDARIAISKFGFKFLLDHGIAMDGFIYNIVDTDNFYPLSDTDEKGKLKKFKEMQKWYNKENKYLMFVGRPNWRKRMTHMMAIMNELKNRGRNDIKLILHSNIHEPASNTNLPEIIDSFNLDNVIPNSFQWDEGIAKGDLNCLYNIADLYIAPHGGEGFGMPIAEAMATGTPFVASDICTTPEFAGEKEERGFRAPVYYPRDAVGTPILDGGVFRSYPKVKEFADLIEKALEDEERLKKMGENGIEWVKQWCAPDVVAEKWKEVFDSFNIKFGEVKGYK